MIIARRHRMRTVINNWSITWHQPSCPQHLSVPLRPPPVLQPPPPRLRFLAVDGLTNQLGAESLIVEGAGHHPHAEMPDLVMPRLLSFIGGVHDRGSNHA